jgi:hypothetical protein
MSEAKSGASVPCIPGYRFAHPGYDAVLHRSRSTESRDLRQVNRTPERLLHQIEGVEQNADVG